MKVSKEFSSRYLKPVDVGNELVVEISCVVREAVGRQGEKRWVMYFEDQQKGLILNATNSRVLAGVYGDDSDGWSGAIVTLFVEETDLGPGVRIRPSTARSSIEKESDAESGPYTEANPPPNMGDGVL